MQPDAISRISVPRRIDHRTILSYLATASTFDAFIV